MKQLYALLLCVTITFVNPAFYAMADTSILQALREHQSYESIKQLLERGADPNGVQHDLQNNPLAYLLDCLGVENKYAIAKLLLNYGADPNALPYIAISAAKCSDKMLTLFLKKGMKLDAYEIVGGKGTPLTQAIAHLEGPERLKRVLKLIKAGAPAQDGCALLEAAAQESEEVVRVLFTHKCPPNAPVRKYCSHTGAMDCTRDEENAYDLYLEFCNRWHPDLLPTKHTRIIAMFKKAQTDPDSFTHSAHKKGIFAGGDQFPVIKSANECMWGIAKKLIDKNATLVMRK